MSRWLPSPEGARFWTGLIVVLGLLHGWVFPTPVQAQTAAPTLSNVTLENDGADNLALSFESDEPLSEIAVTVDGPTSGSDVYRFDASDFTESGTGPYTYTLSTTQAYDDGDGTYTAAVDDAIDSDGNDGADGSQTDSYTLDTTAPTVSDLTLGNDGSDNLALSFESNEPLDAIAVTVDGPSSGSDVYSFSRSDFAESGTGPYTYSLSTPQAYDDGDGTYTAAIDDAVDDDGNDGADGSLTDTYLLDTTAPTISDLTLENDGSDNLTLSFESDEALAEISVSIDGPNTTDVYRFDASDFTESGTGPYTYTLSTTQAYDDGDGIYTAAIDDAVDDAGNDGADGSLTDSYTLDTTAPTISNVSLGNDGSGNLALSFESDEVLSEITVTVDGPTTTDAYTFSRSDFAESGDGPYTYALSTTQPYDDGDGTYTAAVDDAIDDAGNDGADGSLTDSYTLDTTAPTISDLSLENDGSDNLALSFESDEPLSTVAVTVDGPNATDVYSFDASDFTESGDGPYTYTLSTTQPYDDGDGTYTAAIDDAVDDAGNDGADGSLTDSYTLDTTAPTISDLSLGNDGSGNLTLRFESDEALAEIAVSVDGPSSGTDVYSFSRSDFTESGDGPYTYSLSTTQTYDDGDGTYTAAVDDAIDDDGNDGADGSLTDSYTLDTTAPTVSDLSLDNDGSGNLALSFESSEPLDVITVTVDGPNTDDAYTFDQSSFTESGSGPYIYTLSTTQAYDEGDGTYTAAVDDAVDSDGNDGADGSLTDSYVLDTTAPAVSNVSLGNDGSDNLAFQFESSEELESIAVTVDGPNTSDVYRFDRSDFSESSSGSFTYTLSTTQAYEDGDGTYTAAVDEAVDAAGNDGADGSQTDSYTLDTTAPTVSGLSLTNDGSGNLALSFESNEPLAEIAVTVDGPTSGGDVYTFDRSDFTESGSSPYTYTLSTTQAYDEGDGTYTAAVDDAIDDAGNDGADGSLQDTYTLDTTAPTISDLSLGNDGSGNLTLRFQSDEALAEIAVSVDGPSSGDDVYAFDRADFTENGSGPFTYVLDVTQAYDDGDGTYTAAVDDAVDDAGNDGADGTQTDSYTLDTTAPTVSDLSLGNDGSGNLALSFESDESLAEIRVTVNGPISGLDVYRFDESDFVERGDGPYTYELSATQPYDDGDGTYTAAVDDAVDAAGNDGADGSLQDTYLLDTTAPTVVSVSLGLTFGSDGSENLALSFESDEQLDKLTVTVDGPSSGSDVYRFDKSDFAESGDGPFTYQLSTTQPYDDGDGTYTATVDDAIDDAGNDGADGSQTDSYTLDTTAPSVSDVTLGNDGSGNLAFQFGSSEELEAIAVTVDGPNTSNVYRFDRSDFSERGDGPYTYRLSTTQAYDDGDGTYTASVDDAIDDDGNDGARGTETDSYTLDTTPPTLSDLALENDGSDGVALTFASNEQLDSIRVTVDGPGGSEDLYTFGPADFNVGGSGPFTYTLSTAQPYDAGDGTYTAAVDDAIDDAGNDGADGSLTDTYTLDTTAPTLSGVSLGNDGSDNLAFRFESNEALSEIAVTVDGPTSGSDVYRFDASDFTESGSGPYTYSLSTTQAYDDGDGTYTAAVDDAVDDAGNDGADGSQTDSYVLDTTAPTISDVTLDNDGSGNLTFGFQSDEALAEIAVTVDGPNTDDVYAFDASDFTESGDGPYTYELSTKQAYDDGDGTYTAAVDDAIDSDGNDGADGTQTDSYVLDTTPPTISGVTLGNDGSGNLAFSLQSSEPLAVIVVTVDGPNTDDIYRFDASDFTESGDGPYTYTLSATQAYDDGDGTYTAAVDDAVDDAGNDGADGTQTDTYTFAPIAPTGTDDRAYTVAGQSTTTDVLQNDSVPEGTLDPSTVQVVSGPDRGTTRVDGSTGAITYTPESGFTGEDRYTYTASAKDGAPSIRATVVVTVRASNLSVSVTRSFGGSAEEDYRLVALPGNADVSLQATVSDPNDWRGFRENGADGSQPYSRSECTGTCRFRPGAGFWLIAGDPWQIDRSVESVSLNETGAVQVALNDGWNIVSNPLETDRPWSVVQDSTGTEQALWRWDGGWERAQTFRSASEGEAYYFRDDQVDDLVVPYPDPASPSSQAKTDTGAVAAPSSPAPRRTVILSMDPAETGPEELPRSRIFAGIRPGATDQQDRFDQYAPPPYFDQPTLRLAPKGDAMPPALAAEYRAPGEPGYSFNLQLQGAPQQAVTLRAGGLEAFSGQEVRLVERATGETHDLHRQPVVTIVPRSKTTRLRLLVGSREYVETKRQEMTPERLELLPNYPNPFDRATTIEYALPAPRSVRVEVYDILGRRVAVLDEGRREAGFHQIDWQAGRSLSSGTYFLRLQAGAQSKTQKLTVIR